jgi:GNAT superfamily N-acetyltransferase
MTGVRSQVAAQSMVPVTTSLNRPALYMILDPRAPVMPPTVATRYDVIAVANADVDQMRGVVQLDGPLSDPEWAELVERLLPDGMFVARVAGSGTAVGTVGVIHNPRGSRFYFPGGGAIAYLVVDPPHRGQGLGAALIARAITRLRRAGYHNVWLGVEEWRLPAVVTYLNRGFVPFLHTPDPDALAARWTDVFKQIGRIPDPERWPRALLR